eukprot:UN0675
MGAKMGTSTVGTSDCHSSRRSPPLHDALSLLPERHRHGRYSRSLDIGRGQPRQHLQRQPLPENLGKMRRLEDKSERSFPLTASWTSYCRLRSGDWQWQRQQPISHPANDLSK